MLQCSACECNDGNNIDGDGCSAVCTVEAGYQCANTTCTFSYLFDLDRTDGTDNLNGPTVVLYDLSMYVVDASLYEIAVVNNTLVSGLLSLSLSLSLSLTLTFYLFIHSVGQHHYSAYKWHK